LKDALMEPKISFAEVKKK